MTVRIQHFTALEILDSRGNPTLKVTVGLSDGTQASASVPSGASTGEHEARELRDNDDARFGGRGVRRAVSHVIDVIGPTLAGMDPREQAEIDRALIDMDDSPNKQKLGANAVLGASLAIARAGAACVGLPIYRYLGGAHACRLPVPMMNVINGGLHADSSLDFQEFMLVPHGAPSFAEALRYGAETFHALRALLGKLGHATSVGDEGGFAPRLRDNEEACHLIVEAIEAAGYQPGRHISIAIDPAATSFYDGAAYELRRSGKGRMSTQQLVELYGQWVERFPIVSIEDGLAENDWAGFRSLTKSIGSRIQIVGDDIFVTNTKFIERGIEEQSANAVLIKPNQIGTVTETIEAVELCRAAGWRFVISHRSGETDDPFIADFAVAMGGGQIKAGSLCRGERIAKYNRLLEIEAQLDSAARYVSPSWGNTPISFSS